MRHFNLVDLAIPEVAVLNTPRLISKGWRTDIFYRHQSTPYLAAMTYRIGLDIGTTATKACAFNEAGEMIGINEVGYELHHPEPGAAVQNPAAIFAAAAQALAELIASTTGTPASVGLSCPMHSVLLLDENYRPLTNVITWADNRGQAVMRDFTDQQRHDLHLLTGTPVHPMSPLVKLRWLATTQPATFAKAAYLSDLKSALVHRWTTAGLLIDEQLASATGLMNLENSAWADEALAFIGDRLPALPTIRPASTRLRWRAAVAKKLGLSSAVSLYLGGSDGVLANLGSGILTGKEVAMSIGTSAAVRTTHTQARVDPKHGLFNYKMKDGRYVIGGPTNNGGKVLAYWQELLCGHFPDVASFIDGAMTVDPADCPTSDPWLYGERAPLWDATASAALYGLRGHHTPAHLARAVLEGVTNNLVTILRQLEEVTGQPEQIRISGGVTKSPEWVKLIAERTGQKVVEVDAGQASAYGAALVGAGALL